MRREPKTIVANSRPTTTSTKKYEPVSTAGGSQLGLKTMLSPPWADYSTNTPTTTTSSTARTNLGDTSGCGIGLESRVGDYLCKCDICKMWIYSRSDKVRLGPYVSHRDCVKCFICDEMLHDFKIYVQINSQNNGNISSLFRLAFKMFEFK